MCLERNEVAWQSNAQRARDAADAAAASDATGEELAAVWEDVEDCWTIAIAAKNGAERERRVSMNGTFPARRARSARRASPRRSPSRRRRGKAPSDWRKRKNRFAFFF
jgi:hypothetical protein